MEIFNNKYYLVLNQMPLIFFLLNRKKEIIFINKYALDYYNCKKSAVLNKNLACVMPSVDKDNIDKINSAIEKCFSNPEHFEDITTRNENDESFSILWKIRPFLDDENISYVSFSGFLTKDYTNNKIEQNEFYSSDEFLKAVPDLIFVFDEQGRALNYLVNDENDLLIKPDEFLNKKVSDLIPEKNACIILDNIQKVLNTQETRSFEIEINRQNKKIYYEIRMSPISNNKVTAIVRNVTDYRLKSIALVKSELRYKNLINTIPYGIQEINLDGIITFINKSYENIFGYSGDEIIGTSIYYMLAYEKEREQLIKYFEYIKKEKPKPVTYYNKNKNKNGEVLDIKVDWNYIKDENENLTGFIVILSDITQEKIKERALEESEEKYRKLFQQNLNPILILDPRGNYFDANKAALEFLECSFEELTDKSPADFMPPGADKEKILAEHKKLRNKGGVVETEYYVNGKVKVLELFISPGYINNEKVVFGIGTDITKRKKLEQKQMELIKELETALEHERTANEELEVSYEELESTQSELEKLNEDLEIALEKTKIANYYKTEFIANISHEIRTPLNGIIGFNKLLLQQNYLSQTQEKYLNLMLKSENRLLKLLTDVLDLSIIEAGQVRINKGKVDINKLFSDIENTFILELTNKGIDFISDNGGIPCVMSDEKRLDQILINLVGNAIKFTPEGQITVSLEKRGDFYVFSVSDTGRGIEPDKLDDIFKSFITGEPSSMRNFQGVGLGLSISKKLVGLLGGTIEVESEPGKGTTFTFTIPA